MEDEVEQCLIFQALLQGVELHVKEMPTACIHNVQTTIQQSKLLSLNTPRHIVHCLRRLWILKVVQSRLNLIKLSHLLVMEPWQVSKKQLSHLLVL